MAETDKVKSQASFDSFPGVINWISSKCRLSRLADLHRSQKKELQRMVKTVKIDIESRDFKEIEIEVLELVIHHEFFWLEGNDSDKFIGKPGSQKGQYSYNRKIKEIRSYKTNIRTGYSKKICLSNYISQDSDIKVFQLVSDLERGN